MLLEKEEDRKKRFKAMLQYLILREACEFKSNVTDLVTDAANGVDEKKATYASESAEKILKEMELKFYDLFVKDDLVEDYLFFDVPGKEEAYNKKHDFKTQIQTQISDKITVINSADAQNHKRFLKEIVRSPIIENSIMTCDLSIKFKESYLISDIDDVFQLSNLDIAKDRSLHSIFEILLPKSEDDELFKIEENSIAIHVKENSIAIHAHLNTATALSLGFLNLTGKIITKALGDLSGVLSSKDMNSVESPSESVRGKKISEILNSLPNAYTTQEYV